MMLLVLIIQKQWANKTLAASHKKFVYWEGIPPEEVLKQHLSQLRLFDQNAGLIGIRYVAQKAIEDLDLVNMVDE